MGSCRWRSRSTTSTDSWTLSTKRSANHSVSLQSSSPHRLCSPRVSPDNCVDLLTMEVDPSWEMVPLTPRDASATTLSDSSAGRPLSTPRSLLVPGKVDCPETSSGPTGPANLPKIGAFIMKPSRPLMSAHKLLWDRPGDLGWLSADCGQELLFSGGLAEGCSTGTAYTTLPRPCPSSTACGGVTPSLFTLRLSLRGL